MFKNSQLLLALDQVHDENIGGLPLVSLLPLKLSIQNPMSMYSAFYMHIPILFQKVIEIVMKYFRLSAYFHNYSNLFLINPITDLINSRIIFFTW